VRITAIFNPDAGEGIQKRALKALLEAAGHKPRLISSKKDWRKALKKPADAVVAVGGDGTICEVALELAEADRPPPMAILPFGTGNNVGKTLGLVGDARPIVAGWEVEAPRPFDVGEAAGPWGTRRFVESFGAGTIAALVDSPEQLHESSVLMGRVTDRALHRLSNLLTEQKARPWKVNVDGMLHNGRYVAVEILNIMFAGPNLPLAPDADPGDGVFDVVLIGPDEVGALRDYAAERLRMAASPVPALPRVRGREIQLVAPAGMRVHVDDEALANGEPLRRRTSMAVMMRPGAIRVLAG
jgi:diacylglycerol kinase family enzyme